LDNKRERDRSQYNSCDKNGIYFIVPNASRFNENSILFKEELARKQLRRKSYENKLLRSIRPVGINVAFFGYITRDTKREYYD